MAPPFLSCYPKLKTINNCFSSEYLVALSVRLEIKCDPFPVVRNELWTLKAASLTLGKRSDTELYCPPPPSQYFVKLI